MTTPVLILFVAAGAILATQTNALGAVTDLVARGRRLSACTVSDGRVQESDDALRSQAEAVVGRDVSPDAYALARMCRSEEGAQGQVTKVALCHVCCNQADALGFSPAQLVKYHRGGSYFGQQSGGRVASEDDPYEDDLQAAETTLEQRAAGQDSTGGALNFVRINAFGIQLGSGTFDDWNAEMASEGKVPGNLPGIDENIVFYWRGQVPDGAVAL